jgi:hypothetical protein
MSSSLSSDWLFVVVVVVGGGGGGGVTAGGANEKLVDLLWIAVPKEMVAGEDCFDPKLKLANGGEVVATGTVVESLVATDDS